MKKFIIISFVFVMLLAMSAMASETRVMTMGDNNGVLIDDANIWMFPSTIVQYSNQLSAEYEDDDDVFNLVGANWGLNNSNNGTFGTYFSSYTGSDRIHLFYGQQMGENNFGIYANLEQSSYKAEATGDNTENAFSHYDFIFGLSEKDGKWDAAVNLGFGSFTDKDATGTDITEPDGISNLGVWGRYWAAKNPNYTQVYHLGFMTDKWGTKNTASGDTYSEKYTAIMAGCGLNFTPSNNVLAVFDLGVMFENYTEEETNVDDDKQKWTSVPYFKFGMDGEVFKWLDVRFGATSYWETYKDEPNADDSYTYKRATNATYFGLGFNWNKLHVDIEANPQFFFSGPEFLSGDDENLGDSNGSLSVTYDM